MMNFNFNFAAFVKRIPLHSLMGSLEGSWLVQGGFNWITVGGGNWSTAGNKHSTWLGVLMQPIQSLHNLFLSLVNQTRYEMNLNGQVIYLEHYLNDLFDDVNRLIYIEDGVPIIPPFIFTKIENQPDYIIKEKVESEVRVIVRTLAEYETDVDFIVKVPSAIILTQALIDQIKAAVNRYKKAGSRYTIESY